MGLADLYVDPAVGFSLGWAAWVSLTITTFELLCLTSFEYNWSVTLRRSSKL